MNPDLPRTLPAKRIASLYIGIGAFFAPFGFEPVSAAFLISALLLLHFDE